MYTSTQEDIQESWMQTMKEAIMNHHAWHGKISGMLCETVLRDLPVNTYLIRQGEEEFHFYLSFVHGEKNCFKHQPFMIDNDSRQWFYRNFTQHWASTVEGLIPLIMHCPSNNCLPLEPKANSVQFI
jgi:hypothetical protein